MRNRIHNSRNPYQNFEDYPRALCVCSAGLLRSPTMAVVLAGDEYNLNTRAVGADKDHALIPLDVVQMAWADIIIFAERYHYDLARASEKHEAGTDENLILDNRDVFILNIPDRFGYREEALVTEIKDRFAEAKKLRAKSKLPHEIIEVPVNFG